MWGQKSCGGLGSWRRIILLQCNSRAPAFQNSMAPLSFQNDEPIPDLEIHSHRNNKLHGASKSFMMNQICAHGSVSATLHLPQTCPNGGHMVKNHALIRGSSFEPSKFNKTGHGRRGLPSSPFLLRLLSSGSKFDMLLTHGPVTVAFFD